MLKTHDGFAESKLRACNSSKFANILRNSYRVYERLQIILIHFRNAEGPPSNSSANEICTQFWFYKWLLSIHYAEMKYFRFAKFPSIYLLTSKIQYCSLVKMPVTIKMDHLSNFEFSVAPKYS